MRCVSSGKIRFATSSHSRFVILATLPRIARGPTSATSSFAPCLRGRLHHRILWIGGSSHVDRSFVCDHGFIWRLGTSGSLQKQMSTRMHFGDVSISARPIFRMLDRQELSNGISPIRTC
jgi:hypothetical protein